MSLSLGIPLILGLAATLAYADCTLTNTGIKPLPELGMATYQGFPGGLYPNRANNRPPAHLAAGLNIATNQIKPIYGSGTNTNSARIVVLSSGMSNTTQEWASKGTSNFRALVN